VLIVGIGTLAYGAAWRFQTVAMGDSASYRADGLTIVGGWERITDRTPGYPLLLWATGSLHGETIVLFVVQALLHAAAVLLVVDTARRLGIGPFGRTSIAVLLMTLPAMVIVRLSGSEALSQFLIVTATWALIRWIYREPGPWLAVAGASCAVAVWVRPSSGAVAGALALTAAIATWHRSRASGSAASPGAIARAVLVVLGPAVVALAALITIHAVRFDRAEVTPLTGWYLASKTSGFVEELPASYEPGRSILIAERDRQLLLGDEVDAPNYIFELRPELGAALGLDPEETDQWVLGANAHLIARHPWSYLQSVPPATIRLADMESQPPVQALGVAGTWVLQLAHLLLLAAFALQACLAPGILLTDRTRPGRGPLALSLLGALLVVGAVGATSVLLETGASRLRSPVDPLLALILVAGWEIVIGSRRRRGA
jgi:hypothetical protein